MTDRELLELAAKAAGIEIHPDNIDSPIESIITVEEWWWNPLTNDGDALRLAAKLWICIDTEGESICASIYRAHPKDCIHAHERDFDDLSAALRRAIVRAAAELGRTM